MVLALLVLGPLVAWAPVPALAGILIVVAARMVDWSSVRLLRQRSTVLDFVVVAAVAVVAVSVGLVTASGVGVALAILLFLRDQVRGTVIHRKTTGDRVFSRERRLPEDMAVLQAQGGRTVVCELEGNLFFGTTDQLLSQLAEDLRTCHILILDLRRVRTVDLTAIHLLEQMQAQLAERGAHLAFSSVPAALPTGQDLHTYFHEAGLLHAAAEVPVFNQLSDALEWAEDVVLQGAGRVRVSDPVPLALDQIDFLKGRRRETIAELASCVEDRRCPAGATVFAAGEEGDAVYLVRRGAVRIVLRGDGRPEYHLATFHRGDFFGDMAFLDRGRRSAHAVAATETDLYVLSRARFEALAERHPRLVCQVFADLARVLALRLRQADGEIRALQDA